MRSRVSGIGYRVSVVIAILLPFISVLGTGVRAQQTLPQLSQSSYGVQAGAGGTFYSSDFNYLPGYPGCSPQFRNGLGWERGVAASYILRPSTKLLFSLSAGYSASSGTMAVDETQPLAIDGIATPSTFHHAIDFSTSGLTLAPSVGYELLPQLSLSFGGDVGYILSTSFSSREEIAQPTDRGVFADNGLRTRDVYSGALPDLARVQAGLDLGAKYLLPMNVKRTVNLAPSLSYRMGLTDLVRGLPWRSNGLTASLGVEYSPEIVPEPPVLAPPVPMPVKPPVPEPPALIASIAAMGVSDSGIEEPVARLKIEEISETELVPIVPYIFFDSSLTTLPDRYDLLARSSVPNFSISKLPGSDPLGVYRDALNVIGARMMANNSARITITGCNDNESESKQGQELSKARANAVRDYLASVWGIPAQRMTVRARNLPQHPSPELDTDGIQENRRVEIASNSPDILAPVLTADTVRVATPPTIRFRPHVTAQAGVKHWTMTTEQEGRTLATFNGSDSIPKIVDWVLANDPASIPKAPGVLHYTLSVTDRSDQTTHSENDLPVQQQTLLTKKRELVAEGNGNAEIEKYTLLLFDFNSSELSSENAEIARLIRTRIRKGSMLTIEGYGDRIGDVQFNKALADDRAKAAARALGLPETAIVPSDGHTYLYNNNIPEGRFYSRTVEITIRTPLEGNN
ncbi:MAG TPA: OmpA family protein [Candidatus Kapabacteria bacterium]|jgi:outer membrane protein OmpA-like peptidoglycan-associated protein|nr:OmpA family protein [Candidatus Kapabacteria bacterium]